MQWNEFRSQLRHIPSRQQGRIKQAFELGQRMHEGQKRKSGEPYFLHPISVAHMLGDMGADEDTLIAALLHDTVEDTPLTLEEVQRQFGPVVQTLIAGVTKLSEADVRDTNLDAQIETLRKMFTLMQADIRMMVIKLVDRLHNMQTIGFLPLARQQALAKETMEVYVKIADRLCMQDLRDELEALCLGVLQPETFERLSQLRTQNESKSQEVMREMVKRLESHYPEHDESVKTQFEHKSWQNIAEQLQAEGTAVTGVSSITAVFVCDTVDTCYRVMGSLHQMWKREGMSFQDFINSPAINGYRGLHTTVILEDGTRVRCKIRTQLMHEYARKGVTTMCFQQDAKELHSWLPWTTRISPLTEDTQGRSREFWDTLQSDILGDSITIHGPGDQAVQVPKGSTALDGAFYLFGTDALRLESIKIGGHETRLDTQLDHAVSLNMTSGDHVTADRSWLEKANTGFAMATIRSELVRGKQDAEKVPIGRELLQQVLTKRKKGFLEEFSEKNLLPAIQKIGYGSLRDVYVAIADGHLDPSTAYLSLFAQDEPMPQNGDGRQHCIVQFQLPLTDVRAMRRLQEITTAAFGTRIRSAKLTSDTGGVSHFMYRLDLSPAEQESLTKQLSSIGASDVEVIIRTRREIALMACVILPWALNPVVAKWLLFNGVAPLPLITTRLITFSVFTVVFFAIWKLVTRAPIAPIRRATVLALPSATGNLGMTIATYLALLHMPPSVHLTIMRFNTFLLPVLNRGGDLKNSSRSFMSFLLLLAGTVGLLLLALGGQYFNGMLLSVMTLVFYTFYSLSTERTLQQNRINVRNPYLLLHMGLLLGICGVVLALLQPTEFLWNRFTLPAILYVLVCVCLPHACYSALLKRTRFKHFTDLLLMEVPLTMLFEAMILGVVLSPFAYAILLFILVLLALWRWQKLSLPV